MSLEAVTQAPGLQAYTMSQCLKKRDRSVYNSMPSVSQCLQEYDDVHHDAQASLLFRPALRTYLCV